MKFTLTFTQNRILRAYWRTHQPFNVDTLMKDKFFIFRFTSCLCLRQMERKGQIIRDPIDSPWYVGTTESRDEWKHLKYMRSISSFTCDALYLNRYERKEVSKAIREAIKELSQNSPDSQE